MRRAPQYAAGIVALSVNKADPKILQDFLAQKFSLSRRTAKAMIDGRSVWVNRRCVWIARYAIKTGDLIEVPSTVVKVAKVQGSGAQATPATKPAEDRVQQRRHVRVLWQNESYLVVDKPSGMTSCDDPKSVEALLREQESIPTLEAVHRLDRDTTGCMMFAKNHASLTAAVDMFKTHKVSKTYHAITVGEFKYSHQTIDTPLDGESAVSRVALEAKCPDASFLRIRIETGRTNQIRRHLASVRAPVVGDRVYGLKSARDPRLMQVPRQMLHASTLSMPNPLDPHEEIKVHSPLPADFRATLRLFGMGKKK